MSKTNFWTTVSVETANQAFENCTTPKEVNDIHNELSAELEDIRKHTMAKFTGYR